MLTKCVEVTLGQYYRVKGEDGVYYGGPMYYIERGMGRKWKPLAVIFSVTIILGGLGPLRSPSPIPWLHRCAEQPGNSRMDYHRGGGRHLRRGSAGGVKSIGGFCEKLTPAMCLIYVVGVLGVIIINLEHVPAAFAAIFRYAFCTHARCGRFGGLHSCAGAAAGRRPRDLLQRSGLRLIAHHPCDRHHRSPL